MAAVNAALPAAPVRPRSARGEVVMQAIRLSHAPKSGPCSRCAVALTAATFKSHKCDDSMSFKKRGVTVVSNLVGRQTAVYNLPGLPVAIGERTIVLADADGCEVDADSGGSDVASDDADSSDDPDETDGLATSDDDMDSGLEEE